MKPVLPETNTISCIIIDDEAHCANELQCLLASFPQLRVISKITDPFQALTLILEARPELVFLDIEMQGMNGFEILEAISHFSIKPFIIFITAFDHYAIRAIRYAAFDYLLKPVDRGELSIALERFMKNYKQQQLEANYALLLEQTSRKKIRFNTTGGFILVDPQDIIYIQADWNYSEVYLSKEKKEVVALNLGTIEELLPQKMFARINRSVIINLRYLEKVQRMKRLCTMKKESEVFEFRIPVMRIRYLEKLLE